MGRFSDPGAAAGAPGVDPIKDGPRVLAINKAARRAALAAFVFVYLYFFAKSNRTAKGTIKTPATINKTLIFSNLLYHIKLSDIKPAIVNIISVAGKTVNHNAIMKPPRIPAFRSSR